jgi:hypothetical protein
VFPVTTIVFGYAKGSYPPMPPRFSLDQICFEGKYRQADGQAVDDWLSQMIAGYKSTHLASSFDAQLNLYKSKIGQAEADLASMVFYDDNSRQT